MVFLSSREVLTSHGKMRFCYRLLAKGLLLFLLTALLNMPDDALAVTSLFYLVCLAVCREGSKVHKLSDPVVWVILCAERGY